MAHCKVTETSIPYDDYTGDATYTSYASDETSLIITRTESRYEHVRRKVTIETRALQRVTRSRSAFWGAAAAPRNVDRLTTLEAMREVAAMVVAEQASTSSHV